LKIKLDGGEDIRNEISLFRHSRRNPVKINVNVQAIKLPMESAQVLSDDGFIESKTPY